VRLPITADDARVRVVTSLRYRKEPLDDYAIGLAVGAAVVFGFWVWLLAEPHSVHEMS
jgi:hypothetical protein